MLHVVLYGKSGSIVNCQCQGAIIVCMQNTNIALFIISGQFGQILTSE